MSWAIEDSHQRIKQNVGEQDNSLKAFLDFYLSMQHRDRVEQGCPIAALSRDFSREKPKMRREFAELLSEVIDQRRLSLTHKNRNLDREEWVGVMCTYVGALILSRSCRGEELSLEVLNGARQFLKHWEEHEFHSR